MIIFAPNINHSFMKKTILFASIAMLMTACTQKQEATKDNPFFTTYQTTYEVPPFDQIKMEHYLPAFEEGMKQQNAEIEAIIKNEEDPSFDNTVLALDNSGALLDRVSMVFFALDQTDADSTMLKLSADMKPRLAEHGDNIYMNEPLFARIKSVHEQAQSAPESLTIEQKRLTEKYYKRFVRSGIMLSAKDKDNLRQINKELSELSSTFGQNLLAETNAFQLVIDKKEDLAGLPAGIITAAADAAKNRGKEGKWIFTLDKPSWVPFLQYADNRNLREQLYKAMYMRGDNDNAHDNKAIINKTVNLRLQKANLLGYPTFAHYKLDESMAKTPDAAFALLNELWKYALPQAKAERAELQKLMDKEGKGERLESWDWWYYAEKLRKEKYDFDEEQLRPYFKMENVRNGMFAVAGKLFGLQFEELSDAPVYNPEVTAYKVSDADSSLIGVLYLDYFPRASKRGGGWMSNFATQWVESGEDHRPVIYNVGNFTKPIGDTPSLMTPEEVETAYHEFGHALHGLLSKCNYKGTSGTNVPSDFVELPSQIMEHWAFAPEVLNMYAKHYQTGEVIPAQLVKKMENASMFNQGFATTELVAAALMDMNWHVVTEVKDRDVRAFEQDYLSKIGLLPEIIVRYRSTYFAHIFDNDYCAGYYSYLWSEVLDADAFQLFAQNGIFDQKTAASFRENILSKGDSNDPMVLYRQFRGTDPNPKYLLKSRGFVK